MKNIILSIFIFFYIYAINFYFLPITTRVLFGIFGFIWFVLNLVQNRRNFRVDKNLFIFMQLLLLVGFIAMFSIAFNGTTDIEFIKYPLSMINIIFASYFVIKTLNKMKYELNFQTISELVINAVLIQSLIAFIMFAVPDIRDIIMSIQSISIDAANKILERIEFRIIGIGIAYFEAGIISGFTLILIGILLRSQKLSSGKIVVLSLKFLFILVIGMMMARTTLIGALLGLMLIFIPKYLKVTRYMAEMKGIFLFCIIIVPSVIMTVIYYLVPAVSEMLLPLLNFGFELFINYFQNGQIQTESTNQLQRMYLFPDTIKTWLIGDGYYANPVGNGYYMSTDVGYSRLIYYFGLVGLFAYFSMQYYIISRAFKAWNVNFKIYIFIVIYLLILNLKGFADLLLFGTFFWMSSLLNNEKIIKKKEI